MIASPLSAVLLAAAMTTSHAAAAESSPADPGALIVQFTAADLNAALYGRLLGAGGPVFSGYRAEPSRGLREVAYEARVSPPVLRFDDDGGVRLDLAIEKASVHIGRIEKRIAGRNAYCENVRAEIAPERPLDVGIGFRIGLDAGAVQLSATEVTILEARKAVRLFPPSRCRKALLPTRLLWWLGKSRIRRQIGRLDDRLMERAEDAALRISEDDGLLQAHWRIAEGYGDGVPRDLFLTPEQLETTPAKLLVAWSIGVTPEAPAGPVAPPWLDDYRDASFVALSENFVNRLLQHRFAGVARRQMRPSGDFRRLVKSRRIFALIPGLRTVPDREQVTFSLELADAPQIEFSEPSEGSEARIRMSLRNLLLHVHHGETETPLGTLAIERGEIDVSPYWSPAGGISFAMNENRWELSATGLEFNVDLLGTMIEELVFGEVFETQSSPLWVGGFGSWTEGLTPRAFHHEGNHLVIRLGGSQGAEISPEAFPGTVVSQTNR